MLMMSSLGTAEDMAPRASSPSVQGRYEGLGGVTPGKRHVCGEGGGDVPEGRG